MGGRATRRSLQVKPPQGGPKLLKNTAMPTTSPPYTIAEKAPGRNPASSSAPTSCSTMIA